MGEMIEAIKDRVRAMLPASSRRRSGAWDHYPDDLFNSDVVVGRAALPPFTLDAKCDKCGLSGGIRDDYVYRTPKAIFPYIMRVCACGHKWPEEPLDTAVWPPRAAA